MQRLSGHCGRRLLAAGRPSHGCPITESLVDVTVDPPVDQALARAMCSNVWLVARSAHVLSFDPVIVDTTRLQPHDQANDKLKDPHNRRHQETLHSEEAVQ